MNDNDVREMFRRRESDVRVQAPPSETVVRRARRRQIGTVFFAAMVVLTLIAVPLAGLRLIGDRSDDQQTPADPGPVLVPAAPDGQRSAALPYASIAYPDGWFLTDASPLGGVTPVSSISGPVLQLSSFDPDLHDAPLCVFDGLPIPDDGVLLTVGVQSSEDPGLPLPSDPWPVDLGPYPSNMSPSCDQGVALTAGWVAPSGAAYWANATFGKDSTEADRTALETAFASMLFPPTLEPWMSTFGTARGQGSPRLILDSAVFQGVPLNLVAYLDHYKTLWIGVSAPTGNFFGGSALGVGSGSGPLPPIDSSSTTSPSGALVYGDASLDVVRAEIKTAEAKTFPATVVQIPATIGYDRNAVWGFVDGPTSSAQLVGYDANGNLLGDPVITTAPADVIATGTDQVGGAWTLSITHDSMGDGMSFAWAEHGGGSSCCLSDKTFGDHDLTVDGWSTGGDTPSVITAFASTRTAKATAEIDGATYEAQLFPMPPGYVGARQIAVFIVPKHTKINGELVAYDAQGAELERVPLG